MGAVAVGALIMSGTACATTTDGAAGPAPAATGSSAPAVVDVGGSTGRDRTASWTTADWVTYADHVLVVSVVGESGLGTAADPADGMIGRTARLRADQVLWSAPDAPQPAPADLSLSAAGWVFDSADSPVKFALRHSSRLEPGHTYVKALEWIDDPCSDDPEKGSWEGLGAGDTIPFDGGVLGAGEFEGRMYTADEARERWQAGPPGIRRQVAGSSVDNLIAGLAATPAGVEEGSGPGECNPEDR